MVKMLAVVDRRISPVAVEKLRKYGYDCILMPPFTSLAEPVSAHPDMLVFCFDNLLITHSGYYKIAKKEIDLICRKCGFKLILSNEKISKSYPEDVLFNAALIGDKIIGNIKHLSKVLKNEAEKRNIKLLNVNQGYAKCSICKISENAFITADKGIAKALEGQFDILTISDGYVDLKGYDTGFIGGATGADDTNVYFCGDIEKHTDSEKIKAFCKKYSKKAVSLTNDNLYDIGTILLFK